jgi:hypothetical protein
MHISKDRIPKKIDAPGAIARQQTDFGDATEFGMMAGEYFSLAAGADVAPLLEGLKDDGCQAPHWGYMLQGEVVVTYTGGKTETCSRGDLFYWPAGHTVRVVDDSEVILFSPQKEHIEALDHMIGKMKG